MASNPLQPSAQPDEGLPLVLQTFGEAQFRTGNALLALAYAADGSLWSVEESGILRHWDANGHQLQSHFLSDLETPWWFSSGGAYLAAACDELLIWKTANHQLAARIEQPSWVTACAFHPQDSIVATGHDDGVVRLWRIDTEELLREFEEHSLPVSALAFSADGTMLASAGEDRVIKIWDTAQGKLVRDMPGHTDRIPEIAWHPNGKFIVSVGWDATARVWDVATGEPKILLNAHDDQVLGLAFSPDGSVLATSDSASTVHLWGDLLTAQALNRLPGYADDIRALAFSADGKRLAVGGDDRTIHVYDVRSGQLLAGDNLDAPQTIAIWNRTQPALLSNAAGQGIRCWAIDGRQEQPSPLAAGHYLNVAASPDGRWVAGVTPDSLVHLWDEQTKSHHTMDGPRSVPNCLVFGPDSLTLTGAVGNEGTVWVWDLNKLEPLLLVIEATEGFSVESIARHPNGRLLLCGGIDFLSTSGTSGAVCIWDLPEKKRLHSIAQGATAVAFSFEGSRFAFASPDGLVAIGATDSANVALELDGSEDAETTALAFSNDGQMLFAASDDATIRAWDTTTGELLALRQLAAPIHSMMIDASGRLFTGNGNTTCFELCPTRLIDNPE